MLLWGGKRGEEEDDEEFGEGEGEGGEEGQGVGALGGFVSIVGSSHLSSHLIEQGIPYLGENIYLRRTQRVDIFPKSIGCLEGDCYARADSANL